MDAQEFFDRLMEAVKAAAARQYLVDRGEWYDRTYGAANDGPGRAYLNGLLALDARDAFVGILEERLVDDLDRRLDGLTVEQRTYALALQQSYQRLTALPRDLVRERAEVTAAAVDAWRTARDSNDFALFAPHLERVLDVVRQQAVHWGGKEGDPDAMYTALLQGYDPGATAPQYRAIIGQVLSWLPDFIHGFPQGRDDSERRVAAAYGPWSMTSQLAVCRELAEAFGFDFAAGGLDYTEHPFCVSAGPCDVRLTMKHQAQWPLRALAATAHETGHGLLEQNKPELLKWGLPFGFMYPLSTHESQSRLWENHVFRGREFWQYFSGLLRVHHPSHAEVDPGLCYQALHQVRPSLIRIEADEVTYPLHIAIRVELEMALVSGALSVRDLPEAWANRYEELLGVRPPTEQRFSAGVLQDIHWASGYIGYFGTYLLGSMGAAQQFKSFTVHEPEWREQFGRGMYGHLLEWLRENVYPTALTANFGWTMKEATGAELNPDYWEEHIRSTYGQPESDVVRTGSGTMTEG